jgi:hypothetical protein
LLLSALTLSLIFGIGLVVLDTPPPSGLDLLGGAAPLTDQQARNQVIDSARHIVKSAHLDGVSGSAIFLSCTNEHDPPYQAAVYLNFLLPDSNPIKRIKDIASAMVAAGWQEAPSAGEHFGPKLTRDGVTSTFHQNPDDPTFGTVRIYGQCRITTDHHNDNPAFTDIADRLG